MTAKKPDSTTEYLALTDGEKAAVAKQETTAPAAQADENRATFNALATNPACDVDKLERIMAMWERDQDRRAKQEYFAAMNRAQAGIRPVVRDAQNPQTRSNYTRLETMHKAIAPVYTVHGFSVSHDEADGAQEKATRYVALCRHIGGHSESFHIDLALDDAGIQGSKNKTAVHAKASSSSYARRLLEARIFNVVFGGDDDDGNAASGPKIVTDEQEATLRDLLDESGSDLAGFLRWAGVATLAAFPADKYSEAARILKARIK